MVLYHDERNQLINLCQSDSQMHWINLPPDEQLDLEKFMNGHCNILHVGKEKGHTNKDKRSLLTISGRDSYGKNVYNSECIFIK